MGGNFAEMYIMENNTHSLFLNNLVECYNLKFLFGYPHDQSISLFIFSSFMTFG